MIKEKLDEYLEFDSNLLFNRTPVQSEYEHSVKVKRLVRIFGGAIRDIISGQTINDIDIIVGAQSCRLVELTLKERGYTYMESLTPKDLSSVYTDIKVINEPRTWLKGNKIVQLIRPVIRVTRDSDLRYYERGFVDLIQNVDISCCGVSWDGENLYENYPNAIAHCQNLSFYVNRRAKMYSSNRSNMRSYKFISRGWKQIEMDDTAVARDQRIENLLSDKPPIDFISELPNGVYGGSYNSRSFLGDNYLPF
jgi:hypothetical protein